MDQALLTALISGAFAGLAVDLSLFPIDTIKTRLQSEAGFFKSGGFSGIYAGLASVAIGSAPGAALFFVTYELSKSQISNNFGRQVSPTFNHMISSSLAEIVACTVRVPCEILKQRAQAGQGSVREVAISTWKADRLPGFYRGFRSTIFREIPFSVIQFPLWEFLKSNWSTDGVIEPWKSAVAGALAGSVAAFLTTPLDVVKTRIMLNQNNEGDHSISKTLKRVYGNQGIKGLWSGVLPRVIWISVGGFVFLGVYDTTKHYINKTKLLSS